MYVQFSIVIKFEVFKYLSWGKTTRGGYFWSVFMILRDLAWQVVELDLKEAITLQSEK